MANYQLNNSIQRHRKAFLIMLLTFLMPCFLFAQERITLTGTVTDLSGEPLIGATVLEVGTSNVAITDINGNFEIKAAQGVKLSVDFLGFITQEVIVGKSSKIKIVLEPANRVLEDVVVVAYGTQKKATLSGSVAAIGNDELIQTKNTNTQNMLTGKIAGLRVVQTSAEPGSYASNISIRNFGTPLFIVDGVPRDDFSRMDPNDIESISVIKDASAAVYGVRAADGVVVVTTKKGTNEKFQLSYSGNVNLSTSSGMPRSMDAFQYMTMTNEGTMRNYDARSKTYDEAAFEAFRNGDRISTDWYKETIRDITPSHNHTISARGGGKKTDYYISLGYTDEEGFYKSGDLNYEKLSLRSNVTVEPVTGLKLGMNVWGAIDEKNQPYSNPDWILRTIWRQRPTDQVYANNNPEYLARPSLETNNAVARSRADVSGYGKYKNYFFASTFTANYQIPHVKGLSLNLLLSYDVQVSDSKHFRRKYNIYEYDSLNDAYIPSTIEAPSHLERGTSIDNKTLWNASANYDNTFGKHHVAGMFLFEEAYNFGDGIVASRDIVLDTLDELFAGLTENQQGNSTGLYEHSTRAFVGRINYDFAGRYLLEFNCRYDMSSRFPKSHRGGFFPGVSAGWRISDEDWWKNSAALSKINNLKLRASWGKMGREANLDFQFLTGYTYPTGGYAFGDKYIPALASKGLANTDLTWEECYTVDVGLDFEAWNGLLGFTGDIFQRTRNGIFATRSASLPGIVGENLPQENLNSQITRGYDLSVSHYNKVGEFAYSITGNFSFAFNRHGYIDRAKAGNSYDNWRNSNSYRNTGVNMGIGADGQYQNWDEIINSDTYVSYSTLPGDYRYKDWNEDGYIDDLDNQPISYYGAPLYYYGLTFDFNWKGIDFSMLWQGAGRHYVEFQEILRTPLWGGGNSPDYFYDRWHPEDPDANPYDQSIKWVKGKYAYGNQNVHNGSEFAAENAAYLRLKSVELGYTLPKKWLNPIGVSSFRIYANVYNALTFSKLDYVDPEHVSTNCGYIYPINRTFNIGVDIKF